MRKAQVSLTLTVNAIAYGYGPTDNPSDVIEWHENENFEVPEGIWFFFVKLSNGNYDVQKKKIVCEEQCTFEMIITRTNNIQCLPISFDQSKYVRQCGNVTMFTVGVKDNLNQLVEFEINNSGLWQDATNGKDIFTFSIAPPALNVSLKARIKGCINFIGQSLLTCNDEECNFLMTVIKKPNQVLITTGTI